MLDISPMSTIGSRIREARIEEGLTQEELAWRCGWDSQGRISNYERDLRTPGWEDLERISYALTKPLAWFFASSDDPGEEGGDNARRQGADSHSASGLHFPGIHGTALLQPNGTWQDTTCRDSSENGSVTLPCEDPTAYALQFRGDSLHPAIRNGWLAILSPEQAPSAGDLVLVQNRDGSGMIKEFLWERSGNISLLGIREAPTRFTLLREEIRLLHPVIGIVPPSQATT